MKRRSTRRHAHRQAGFAVAEILIAAFVILAVAGAGWYVYHRHATNQTAAKALNAGALTAGNYSVQYENNNASCSSFKSPFANSGLVQQALAAYVQAGFSQQFVNSHFKLKSVSTFSNPSVAPDGPETDLIFEVCFGARAIPTEYDVDPGGMSGSPDIESSTSGGDKFHDVATILPYSTAAGLLRKCAAANSMLLDKDVSVGLGDPTGQGVMPENIYMSSVAINGYTGSTFAIDLGSGKCYKQIEYVNQS